MRASLAFAGSMSAFCICVSSGAWMIGCATGGVEQNNDGGFGSDATARDGSSDSGSCPTGRTGPSCQNCASGFHTCGTSCEQDHPNVPDAGCTQGCNTACPAPTNATAKCTSDGLCDFACNTSFDKTDGGCVCPTGTMDCNGTCQQCCTDTDCPNHQLCQSGTCGGCQAGWGDCNSNPGCETQLNSTSNCGACGHSCCSGLCCGFLGLGGSESCKASGSTYACGC